jgi:hypothetical protein
MFSQLPLPPQLGHWTISPALIRTVANRKRHSLTSHAKLNSFEATWSPVLVRIAKVSASFESESGLPSCNSSGSF